MATQKLSGTRVPATSNDLTVDRLFSAPLPELLAETDAVIVESSITDDEFFGAVTALPGGRIQLYMPAGRDAVERDHMVRVLVGRLVGASLAPLPATLKTLGGAR